MSYINPRSVTFWAGAVLLVMGLIIGIDEGYSLGGIADVLRAWTGGVGSGALVFHGLGLIGLRRAIERANHAET